MGSRKNKVGGGPTSQRPDSPPAGRAGSFQEVRASLTPLGRLGALKVAAGLGLEPRISRPERDVLPLHHPAIIISLNTF